jgi:hypothetical protein
MGTVPGGFVDLNEDGSRQQSPDEAETSAARSDDDCRDYPFKPIAAR